MEPRGFYKKYSKVMQQHQRDRVHHKPLEAIGGKGRMNTNIIATLWCDGSKPVITRIGHQNHWERVQAQTIKKDINRETQRKAKQHQQKDIELYRQEQNEKNI